MYQDVADLIWKESPNLSATQVAKSLTKLHKHFPKGQFPPYVEQSIRKILKGRGPGKQGRPPKSTIPNEAPNLDELPNLEQVISKKFGN